NDVSARRVLHQFFGKRDVVNTIVDTIAPLFDVNSGFTTSKSLGVRRGDNAQMVKLELIKKPATMGTFKSPKAKPAKAKAVKPAAKKAVTKPAPKTAEKKVAKKAPTKKAPAKKESAKKATKATKK
ncbi:MAG TPA: hypothetical protein VF209_00525, partial [Patescibacteria group bacterium]